MSLRPAWFDDFLPEEEFAYWSGLTPSAHAERMQRDGPGEFEINLYYRCKVQVGCLVPDLELVQQVDWPVMNQLPPGRVKELHTDPGIISCVYHCSPEWGDEDKGALAISTVRETIAVNYRPNRLVIFDASVPHLVEAPGKVRNTALVPFLVM